MYGWQNPQDFVDKFERPYAPLLLAGVVFYASLGNHDDQGNRFYKGSTWAASAINITYFIDGSSGQLRKGDITRSAMTAAAFDQDQTFMLVEIDGDTMFFQAISRTCGVVDSSTIRRRSTD